MSKSNADIIREIRAMAFSLHMEKLKGAGIGRTAIDVMVAANAKTKGRKLPGEVRGHESKNINAEFITGRHYKTGEMSFELADGRFLVYRKRRGYGDWEFLVMSGHPNGEYREIKTDKI